jgi:GntR family transcriptional regulator/MocR family aminotransferase
MLERMARMRVMLDRQGDLAVEGALAELMEDGEIQRHIWRTRRVYHARRDAFVEVLCSELAGALSFDVPAGGIAMWVRVAPGIDADAWARRARDRNVVVVPGRSCRIDNRRRPFLRLGFTRHDEQELRAGVRALAAALAEPGR